MIHTVIGQFVIVFRPGLAARRYEKIGAVSNKVLVLDPLVKGHALHAIFERSHLGFK